MLHYFEDLALSRRVESQKKCFIHSRVSASQAFFCSIRGECLCEACPEFILIQSCFPTPKFAWTVVQTMKNDGIDPISLLTRCDRDNWWSCVGECAKRKLKIWWCPTLPPLANTPRPFKQLCLGLLPPDWRLVAQGSDGVTAPAPHMTTLSMMFQPKVCPPGPREVSLWFLFQHAGLGKRSSSSFHLLWRREEAKKEKRMKNKSKRRKNIYLTTTGDLLKCPYNDQTFWGASVRAGMTGGGRKKERKKSLHWKLTLKKPGKVGLSQAEAANLSCAYHSV